MDFGLGLMGYNGCWDDAAFAEEHGFSTAGFVDSPLLGGDPFVCLGLAAQATSRLRIGTFLTIPGNRNAAVVASAIGTVNMLAPGRSFLGIGTGYTGRATFGLGPVAAWKLRDFARDCRELLAGEEATHRAGTAERQIRFRHKEDLYLDGEDIPIYVGADGPKALEAAGQSGDGLVITLQYANTMVNAPEVFAGSLASAKEAATAAGREWDDVYTMWSIVPCILEEGESAASDRVLERVGAAAMMAYHSYACNPAIGEHLPPPLRERLEIYDKEVISRFDVPPELVYQEAHAGHLSHMLDGEAKVLTEDLVRMTTLTGTPDEITGQLRKMEAVGLKNVSFWFPPHLTRESILEFEEKIIPRLGAAAAT